MAGASPRATSLPLGGACEPVASAQAFDKIPAAADDARFASLLATIECEIIPRLVLAHRDPTMPVPAGAGSRPTEQDVEALARLLLLNDGDAVSNFVAAVRGRGVALEAVFLELLAPAAHLLGRWWERDLCDFTAVTIGLWRLQRVLYELSPAFQIDAAPPRDGRRVLLAPTPNEQHTFGLFLVAELLRRDGWEVVTGPSFTHDELLAAVRDHWFSALGLSLCAERWLDALARAVCEVRRASRNRAIVIIVGGAFFVEHPEAAARVGADGTAADARQAVTLARRLVAAARGGPLARR